MQILTYSNLEDKLVERLAELRGLGYYLGPFPENKEAHRTASGNKPRVTVSYGGSNFGESSNAKNPTVLSGQIVTQQEFCEVNITVEAKRLRGDSGIYAAIDRIYPLILGYQVPGWSAMFLKGTSYVKFDKGLYTFMITFSCDRLIAPQQNDNLQNLTLSGNLAPTETTLPDFQTGQVNVDC